jgi:hypothetical protein
MAHVYPALSQLHQEFIARQHVFFVATAPLAGDGHVNLSPKGYDTFRILSANEVAYLDLTGSGNETSGHLAENGRITLMFCAFEGSPLILRLYGRGQVVLPGSERWGELRRLFGSRPGTRQIITVNVHRVQTSCGYAVPLMDYRADRDTLERWAVPKETDGIRQYWQDNNRLTVDGLPTPLGASLGLGETEN